MTRIALFAAIVAAVLSGCAQKHENAVADARNAGRDANPAETAGRNSPANADRANAAVPRPRAGATVSEPVEFRFENGVPEGWRVIDPDPADAPGFATGGGVLRLTIPTGRDLFGENRTAPRLLRDIAGDFEIETRVRFAPAEDYQGAGLIVFRNDSNYLRLERAYGGSGGGGSGIRFDRAEDETYEPIATPEKLPTRAADVELRIRRSGSAITAFWRVGGSSEWAEAGRVANTYPESVAVGLIGVSTGAAITAEFLYIRLRPLGR